MSEQIEIPEAPQMSDEERKLRAQAEALVHIQAAIVSFAQEGNPGSVSDLDVATVDDLAVSVSRYTSFCIYPPSSKPYLADIWLWLAARCWKMGKKARDLLADPRVGLPGASRELLMDQVTEVAKGQWSPAQAAIIRKALSGEMPLRIWQLAQGWRSMFTSKQKETEAQRGKVLVEEDGQVRTTERGDPNAPPPDGTPIMAEGAQRPTRKKKIRVKIKKRKAKQ